ncbi:HAD superfamily hydrolase [Natrialba magadii ATCC 43099]|uniref:HAD superfamily hydrolase n=2 Tax=Natrialba magadii (strain ATCC 43099 / DSM 3394 / CCM 3739 / CIP 104546 / IAM 13178 / JCM 8861 / NBRC 102185 / NCIMB 2190 / MS3) TaxID=547559 RepID=D3SS23_NATMM|nr:HAD family hydrolase [Natrialba magadii]ADD04749.1 HAD superfamily hydrolase [Natrialba magadii ATCC 43099]
MDMDGSYDAILFDNDGVLTTPTDRDVLLEAMTEAFATVGVSNPPQAAIETLLSPDVDSLRTTAVEHGVEPQTLWTAREEAAIAAQRAELTAGRKQLYDDTAVLDSLSQPTAIVSNNQHETIGNILEHLDLPPFEVWYGREPTIEGINRKKPRPYYLEQAIDELGATEPLYVGDSYADVAAAAALDIDVAFIRREHREGYTFDGPARPTFEIESLRALPLH